MTRSESQLSAVRSALELLCENGLEEMAKAMEVLINESMKLEREEFLGAGHYERTEKRRGYANGFKAKSLKTRVGAVNLEIPQVRDVREGDSFYPKSLERGERSERALKLAIAEMYVRGVSTRKVKQVTEKLCGLEVTSSQVSRAAEMLDEELDRWRNRDLGEAPYIVLDARYEKVRHGGSALDCTVLVAAAVLPDGKRTVLGTSVALSEAEVHWREFLTSLLDRGLRGVRMITSDAHSGLRAAVEACFPGAAWQRCQFHLQQNASAYAPSASMRPDVANELRAIFNAPDRVEADRLLGRFSKEWSEKAPRLVEWADENVPQGLQVFALPQEHRRRLRTSNMLERLNKEIKRRTAVATLFPNERALMRLVTRDPRRVRRGVGNWKEIPQHGTGMTAPAKLQKKRCFFRALRWPNPHRLSSSHYEAVSARHKNIDDLTHGNHLPFPQRNRNANGHIFRCSFGIQKLHRHYVDSAELIDRILILDKSTIIYRFAYHNGTRAHTSNNVSPSPSFARCQKTNLYFCIWNQKPSPT